MADPEIVVRGRFDDARLNAGLSRTTSRLGRFAGAAGRAVALGTGVAVVAAAQLGQVSVQAASDAQQSVGATRTVYEKYAAAVIKSSRRAADAVGLSANEYRENANVLGALLKNQGVGTDKLAGQTQRLVRQGADLAATFGGPTRQAVEALASAYKGEFDPLEQYGISLKQSTVNTAALGVANVKTTTEFKKLSVAQQTAAKRQATTNLIMLQGKDAAGAFARESNTLAGQQQRLSANVENLQAKLGKALLPALTDLTRYGNTTVVPWLDRMITAFRDGDSDVSQMAGTFKGEVAPALKTIGDALRDAYPQLKAAVQELPSLGDVASVSAVGIRFLADHVHLLADALPFLAIGFAAFKAAQLASNVAMAAKVPLMIAQIRATRELAVATRELAAAQGTQTAAAARSTAATAVAGRGVSKLGKLARGTAGIAGLGALAVAGSTSSDSVGLLSSALGGALTGGMLAPGPWGVLGGAVAGVGAHLLTTRDSTVAASEAFGAGKKPATDYASSLDEITGAAQRATKEVAALALQQKGGIEAGRTLGIASKDLVGYLLGNEKATRRVNEAMRLKNITTQQEADAVGKLDQVLGNQRRQYQQQAEAVGNVAIASGKLGRALGDIKGRGAIVAKVEQKGFPETERGLGRLLVGLDKVRSKRQIQAVIKALGIDATVKGVRKVIEAIEAARQTRGDLPKFERGVRGSVDAATREGKRGGEGLKRLIEGPLRRTSGDVPKLSPDLQAAINRANAIASSGGQGVGSALKSGVLVGMSGLGSALASRAASAVSFAIAAARAAAKAKSPSREMMLLGKDMSDGLVIGIAKRAAEQKKAGKDAVLALLSGVTSGASGAQRSLDKITKLIEKRIKGKGEAARERATRKHLKDEYAAITQNAKAQDKLNGKLKTAVDRLKAAVQARRDYAAAVKSGIVEFGNITQLGQNEDGTVSLSTLLQQGRDRLSQARRFADLIQSLSGRLNRTSLQQLIDAGVSGGLATAEALAAGGDAAITETNAIAAELARVGQQLGTRTAGHFHDAGVRTAQGLVRGLESQERKLDKVARRLARKLAQAVREELGIRSPSRAFEKIGGQTVRGLELGLDETRARRAGAQLATAVQDGFKRPQLTTAAPVPVAGAAGSWGGPRELTLTLSADTMSALEQGRVYTTRVNLSQGAGGKRVRSW